MSETESTEAELTEVEALLVAAGVEVVFRKKLSDGVALGLRVQARSSEAWNEFIRVVTYRSAVAAAQVKPGTEAPYYVELAKVFYYDAGRDDTVWLWRLVLRGDFDEITDLLTRQDFTPSQYVLQLTSFPLGPGRIVGRPDKLKGVHAQGVGESYVSRAADVAAQHRGEQ